MDGGGGCVCNVTLRTRYIESYMKDGERVAWVLDRTCKMAE